MQILLTKWHSVQYQSGMQTEETEAARLFSSATQNAISNLLLEKMTPQSEKVGNLSFYEAVI